MQHLTSFHSSQFQHNSPKTLAKSWTLSWAIFRVTDGTILSNIPFLTSIDIEIFDTLLVQGPYQWFISVVNISFSMLAYFSPRSCGQQYPWLTMDRRITWLMDFVGPWMMAFHCSLSQYYSIRSDANGTSLELWMMVICRWLGRRPMEFCRSCGR